MAQLRKNILAVSLAIFSALINYPTVGMAATTQGGDITALQGMGTLYNVDVFRIDSSGNITFSSSTAGPHTQISSQGNTTHWGNVIISSGSSQYFGEAGVAQSTASTAINSQGTIRYVLIVPGAASSVPSRGSVICSSTPVSNQITGIVCPSIAGAATNVLGIAAVDGSTGTVQPIFTDGWVNALTTGTVNPGDIVGTTGTIRGFLWTVNVASIGVGVALTAGNSAGGLTKIRLNF